MIVITITYSVRSLLVSLSVTFSFVPVVRPFFVPLLVSLMAGADVGNTSQPLATSQAYDVSVTLMNISCSVPKH